LFFYTELLCLHQCLLHTPLRFKFFSRYALCVISISSAIPLLSISATAHSSFYTPECLTTTATHLFFVQHTYSLCAPSACSLAMLLHALSMSSDLPDHHHNSSASLAVRYVCQLLLRTVFITLADSLRLFSFSGRNYQSFLAVTF
jgi:hypothetical protein